MIPNRRLYGKRGLLAKLDKLVLPLIVVLVGVAAFGLGRLSNAPSQKGSLIIHSAGEVAGQALSQGTTSQITVH